MKEASEPERYSHEQAGLIAARLTTLMIQMMERHENYFQTHWERFKAWQVAMDEHFTAAETKNYFDAVVVLDRFLTEAFVLDAPIFPRNVIQEFSDVRQGF